MTLDVAYRAKAVQLSVDDGVEEVVRQLTPDQAADLAAYLIVAQAKARIGLV